MEGRRACPNCATDNPERARFCMSCGAELAPRCPECGAENPTGAKFCMECGTGLSDAIPAAGVATPAAGEAEAPPEGAPRGAVGVARPPGYSGAAEGMDPEAVKALVGRTLRVLGEQIERF